MHNLLQVVEWSNQKFVGPGLPVYGLAMPIKSNPALLTPHYYGQFDLSLGKQGPSIFSKFNPLNTDTFHGPLSVRINGVWLYTYSSEKT